MLSAGLIGGHRPSEELLEKENSSENLDESILPPNVEKVLETAKEKCEFLGNRNFG